MVGQYDAILASEDDILPLSILIQSLKGGEFFVYLFPIVLFGTFVETGAAMIHGVNERIERKFQENGGTMSRFTRFGVAITILVISILLADLIGLTQLVAKGYGTITWGFLIIFVFPLMTYGIWKIYSTDEC